MRSSWTAGRRHCAVRRLPSRRRSHPRVPSRPRCDGRRLGAALALPWCQHRDSTACIKGMLSPWADSGSGVGSPMPLLAPALAADLRFTGRRRTTAKPYSPPTLRPSNHGSPKPKSSLIACTQEEFQALRGAGLGRGGDLTNAVLYPNAPGRPVHNAQGLRCAHAHAEISA